jgi:hypothetical protein
MSIVNKGTSKLIAVGSNNERRILISEVSNKAYEELNLFQGCSCTYSFASRDILIFV